MSRATLNIFEVIVYRYETVPCSGWLCLEGQIHIIIFVSYPSRESDLNATPHCKQNQGHLSLPTIPLAERRNDSDIIELPGTFLTTGSDPHAHAKDPVTLRSSQQTKGIAEG